jgi:UDP:flavonoid glycosyltransferase YjiC (YdhE family)
MYEKQKKVAIMVPPASGHLNPAVCLANELVKNQGMHVTVFSSENYRNLIEKSGSVFRAYSYFDMSKTIPKNDEKANPSEFFNFLIDTGIRLLPELKEYCNKEKPDLIIFDNLSLHSRYLYSYLKNQHKLNKLDYQLPKFMVLYSSFAQKQKIYPNSDEIKMIFENFGAGVLVSMITACIKQFKTNMKLGLDLPLNPIESMGPIDEMNICCVFHELQPRADNMIDKIKFVGPFLDDQVRNDSITNEKLKEILSKFEPKNPIDVANFETKYKLVYVSLGTLFNNKINVFEKIIDAFRIFDQEPNAQIKSNDLEVVISVGKDVYELFENKIKNENYKIPENVLILPSVPQIEILKRASLFITHAGMNSTSETIHYGVPVISIPILAEQPLNAYRICDELQMGIKLKHAEFTPNQLRKNLHEVLSNKKYLENVLEFTNLSRKTNGCRVAGTIIKNYLN